MREDTGFLGSGVTTHTPATGSNLSGIAQGTQLLIIDAGSVPSLSRRFRAQITPQGVRRTTLVLTHHHADHVFGSDGISADITIASMNTERLLTERGETERQHLIRALPDAADELDTASIPRIDEPVSSRRELELDGRAISLIPVGPAHSPGDLAVYDHDSATLFTGDIAFNGLVPVFRDADSGGWIRALEHLLELAPTRVVPGHGPVGGAEVLTEMIDLILALRDIVSKRQGALEPSIELSDLPTRFQGLSRPDRLPLAARALTTELMGPAEASAP